MGELQVQDLVNDQALRRLLNEAEERGYARGYEEGISAAKAYLDAMPHGPQPEEHPDMLLSAQIEDLDLAVRSYNCLEKEGVRTVGDLLEWEAKQLLDIRNFGQGCLDEVRQKLAQYGYTLKGEKLG